MSAARDETPYAASHQCMERLCININRMIIRRQQTVLLSPPPKPSTNLWNYSSDTFAHIVLFLAYKWKQSGKGKLNVSPLFVVSAWLSALLDLPVCLEREKSKATAAALKGRSDTWLVMIVIRVNLSPCVTSQMDDFQSFVSQFLSGVSKQRVFLSLSIFTFFTLLIPEGNCCVPNTENKENIT